MNELPNRIDTAANAPSSRASYPIAQELIPDLKLGEGRYRCRFAQTEADLEAALRLRYEVFNLELGEGLASSHATGLDRDRFDWHCHHLLVEDTQTEAVVGTYRIQVSQMAAIGHGFYTAQEFDLSAWPHTVVDQLVEIGRACVHKDHRRTAVLLLLWKGQLVYALHNRRRYFFGCCSIPSQDPAEGARVLEYLKQRGHMHPELWVDPQPAYELNEARASIEGWEQTRLPKLFRAYLRYGGRVCGRPALDREFSTIDFLALVDVSEQDLAKLMWLRDLDLSSGA